MKKKFRVLGKFRGMLCDPEVCEISEEHCKDKETLESALKLEAGVDQIISYEEIYDPEA